MVLEISDIEYIADLARLHLSEEEKTMYVRDLSAVFAYVEMLNAVDTDGVEETCQVTGIEQVVRADIPVDAPAAVRRAIIDQFPAAEGDLLRVPGVFSSSAKNV